MRYARVMMVVAAITGSLLLSGCDNSPPSAGDPRKGRTTITWSDCGFGYCIYDWKICVGADLQTHISGDVATVKDSPECKP